LQGNGQAVSVCYGAIRDWDDTATTPVMFG
jgi:hypothetical protein